MKGNVLTGERNAVESVAMFGGLFARGVMLHARAPLLRLRWWHWPVGGARHAEAREGKRRVFLACLFATVGSALSRILWLYVDMFASLTRLDFTTCQCRFESVLLSMQCRYHQSCLGRPNAILVSREK